MKVGDLVKMGEIRQSAAKFLFKRKKFNDYRKVFSY